MKTCLLTEGEVESYARFPLYSSKSGKALSCQRDEVHETAYHILKFNDFQSDNTLAKLACIVNGQKISLKLKNGKFRFDYVTSFVKFNNTPIFSIISIERIKSQLSVHELYAEEVYKGLGELITERLNNALEY